MNYAYQEERIMSQLVFPNISVVNKFFRVFNVDRFPDHPLLQSNLVNAYIEDIQHSLDCHNIYQ